MKVNPITEAEATSQASAFSLWPKGVYDFEVVSAVEKVSRKGADMIELEVRVFNAEGRTRVVRDWLLEGEYTSYKVRHFAAAVGLLDQYEKGALNSGDLAGRTGRLKLGINRGKLKDESDPRSERYPDQNSINDYLTATAAKASVSKPADMDDVIPF